jgi:membrane associated rhomboid family serine protease
MYDPNPNTTAVINPLPRVIVVLVVAMILPELVLQLSDRGYLGGPTGIGWRTELIREFGFFDSVFEYMRQTRTFDWNTLHRFVTYPFLNYDLLGAVFSAVLTLALGKGVAEYFSWWAVLILFFAASIVGGLAMGFAVNVGYPVIGAQAPIFGLIGAYSWMLWLKAGRNRRQQFMAFRIVIFLTLISFIYFFFFNGGYFWISQLAGFAIGFALSFILAPDGQARVGRWIGVLRQR